MKNKEKSQKIKRSEQLTQEQCSCFKRKEKQKNATKEEKELKLAMSIAKFHQIKCHQQRSTTLIFHTHTHLLIGLYDLLSAVDPVFGLSKIHETSMLLSCQAPQKAFQKQGERKRASSKLLVRTNHLHILPRDHQRDSCTLSLHVSLKTYKNLIVMEEVAEYQDRAVPALNRPR